jgi:hypothetical protein
MTVGSDSSSYEAWLDLGWYGSVEPVIVPPGATPYIRDTRQKGFMGGVGEEQGKLTSFDVSIAGKLDSKPPISWSEEAW